jgi:atypical dual specificity phosphatase
VAEGISIIINLHPRPHEPKTLARFKLEELHLPVEDLVAPSPEQLRSGVGAIAYAADVGRRVVVHCAAGLGRAGTLVSCYLTTTGLSADESIARVRSLRPGSVETDDQVQAVRSFALRHQ